MRIPTSHTVRSAARRAGSGEELVGIRGGVSEAWHTENSWVSEGGVVALPHPAVLEAPSPLSHAERANALTHGLAGLVAFLGVVYLLGHAIQTGSVSLVVGCGIYGATLVGMYLASYLCHSATTLSGKHRWRLADHISIYLLIAGSYTPFLLTVLWGTVGKWMLVLVWAGALGGIVSKLFYSRRLGTMSVLPYVFLGWLAIAASRSIITALPWDGIAWLVAGGVFYTVGIRFFLQKSVPYAHTVWHVFVIAGTACHYFAVLYHVLPSA